MPCCRWRHWRLLWGNEEFWRLSFRVLSSKGLEEWRHCQWAQMLPSQMCCLAAKLWRSGGACSKRSCSRLLGAPRLALHPCFMGATAPGKRGHCFDELTTDVLPDMVWCRVLWCCTLCFLHTCLWAHKVWHPMTQLLRVMRHMACVVRETFWARDMGSMRVITDQAQAAEPQTWCSCVWS